MKHMRLAICVAVFALVGGIAMSEDLDVRALQAKLAAQEARLNDLQAKMAYSNNVSTGSVADGVLSMNKNAVVTIGGNVNTRYFGRSGKISGGNTDAFLAPYPDQPGDGDQLPNPGPGKANSNYKSKIGDLSVSDAQVFMKIDVNDYFDAYLAIELQNSTDSAADNAKQYWVRWKNLCNSGFGVLVGRSDLVFGDGGYGVITGYTGGDGSALADALGFNPLGPRIGWDRGRTTQITPYWESQDGKIKAELSFIQGIDERGYGANGQRMGWANFTGWDTNTRKYRSHNYGVGSMSARLVVNPIEGLKLSGSFISLYNNNTNSINALYADPYFGEAGLNSDNIASRNTAFDLAFQYRPCFFNRLNIWTQWIHSWNDGFMKDRDSDAVNFGASFDITDNITFFAQGDYVRIKQDKNNQPWGGYEKATGWAFYTGLQYRLPYGVDFEVGYRHDKLNYKNSNIAGLNGKWAKFKADTIYGHLGFNF